MAVDKSEVVLTAAGDIKVVSKVWATLLTKSDYLAGLLVLAHSLQQHKSRYPLIVLTTSSLPDEAVEAIKLMGLQTRHVDYLEPSAGWSQNTTDQRFRDTWTKLTAFSLDEYERVVLLDSDMLITQNMDELMTMPLSEGWMAAAHACTCNPRKLKHYPRDWIPENCPHTQAKGTIPIKVTAQSIPTHQLLNSGLVVIRPSQDLFRAMVARLHNDPVVQTFTFPDQDFLALFFKDRWIPLGYQYNALKTLRACHPNMWRDEDVKNVHYIIDKPWSSEPKHSDPVYELNCWWWTAFHEAEQTLKAYPDALALVKEQVARF